MADQLGRINVPYVAPVGVLPLTVAYGFTKIINPPQKTFTFLGAGTLKREQTYLLGSGARQWRIDRQDLSMDELDDLRDFWESRQSAYEPFTFNEPMEDGTTVARTVQFVNQPIEWDYKLGMVNGVTIDLLEVATGNGPIYPVAVTLTRFPDTVMAAAMTGTTQQCIKLVRIIPKEVGYPAIYISDQRCTIGTQLYLPRLLRWSGIRQVAVGMPNVSTESDNVQLVLGNADRVMSQLVNDVQLDRARVECLMYHVNSQTLIELWAGDIVPGGWQSNVGPEFGISASDPLQSPFLIWPPRVIDRKCNRFFDDPTQSDCPFRTVGAMNLTEYPDGTPASCDHGYVTPNGCRAHGMDLYYNGVMANPQSIRTKDNSTGFWGLARNALTASSIINDAAYGHCIPVVVTDIAFPVAALIVAIRDEEDFLRGIGIAGEGPMEFAQECTLDGNYNHGYPGPLGSRMISGADPAIPANGPTGNLDGPLELYPFDLPLLYSAGVAAVELLIKDSSGIQPTLATQHVMEAVVTSGWKGWKWTGGAGTRQDVKVSLTNPVWLTVNMFLAAKRRFNATAAEQEAMLDLNRIIPAAAICDLLVDRLVELDEGQETQWKFIGVMQDPRALRDWMADVLLNCLGVYYFNFGRLAIDVRENGASTVAYTAGNIIYGSLKLSALGPQFTRLIATFADREHAYVANTATFQDDDYAVELGEGVRALHHDSPMNLSGTADISPASRAVNTRGREEIGGVTASERKNARRAEWQTSILGLDTYPGTVASISDPEVPLDTDGGPGKFRVEVIELNDDWSISIIGRACTDSMYDLVQGPKPSDVRPGVIPGGNSGSSNIHHACPMPHTQAPIIGDHVYEDAARDLTFKMQQLGTTANPSVAVTSDQPVNAPVYFSKPGIADFAYNPTLGNLLGGHTYYFSLAVQRGTKPSVQSRLIVVDIPAGSNTNSVQLTGLSWPPPPPDGPWEKAILYGAVDNKERLCMQMEFDAAAGPFPDNISYSGDAVMTLPTTPMYPATYAPANLNTNIQRVKLKELRHVGAGDGIVTEITAEGARWVMRCMHLASDRTTDINPLEGGINWNPDATLLASDDWTNRIVSFISHKTDGIAPVCNLLCLGYDPVLGKFYFDTDLFALGIGPGDIFVIRFEPQWAADGLSFTDDKMTSGQYPFGTADPADGSLGARVGRVIGGPGRFQIANVVSHVGNVYAFDKAFVGVTQDSIIIIEFLPWLITVDGPVLSIADYMQQNTINPAVNIAIQRAFLVQLACVDNDRQESPDPLNPSREMFVYGDVNYGGGGVLQLGAAFLFGRGGDGGPADVQVGDISNIEDAAFAGEFQGWSITNEGNPVGDSHFDIQRYDAGTDTYLSVLGGFDIIIPSGTHDKLIFTSAFLVGINPKVKTGDLFKAVCLSVGATPPKSVVIKCYWGTPLLVSTSVGSGV